MKVKALQNTFCSGIRFERDVIYHIDAAIAHALGDSVQILEYDNEPAEVTTDDKPKKKVKEVEAPVVDKMIKQAPVKKSASRRKS